MRSTRRRQFVTALTFCLTALLSACSGSGSYCAVASQIGVEDGDVLTEKTARRVLTHDLTYEKLCT